MTATTKIEAPLPHAVDTYLGFEIRQISDATFVAFPLGWAHKDVTLLEASYLPSMRKRIWSWWHRFLD